MYIGGGRRKEEKYKCMGSGGRRRTTTTKKKKNGDRNTGRGTIESEEDEEVAVGRGERKLYGRISRVFVILG